jgi:primosomal protein N' (replication factor Y)
MYSGMRVLAPFGNRQLVGYLLETVTDTPIAKDRIKKVIRVLDPQPAITPLILNLCQWAASYYHHPIGDVLQHAVPALLRQPETASIPIEEVVKLTPDGLSLSATELRRAPRQREIYELLKDSGYSLALATRKSHDLTGSSLAAMVKKGWLERTREPRKTLQWHLRTDQITGEQPYESNQEQQQAISTILGHPPGHQCYLLDGITGSGKTEVYLQVIQDILQKGRQALVLVPEIGLTPQTVNRFKNRFSVPMVVLHSALTDRERLEAWQAAASEEAAIIIGTRSAIFTPLSAPGVIVVDEEHDLSYKQQEGFRYSARDLAVKRASLEGIPVILGSATPSLESIHNANRERYKSLRLTQRTGQASIPKFKLHDIRNARMHSGFSEPLLTAISDHLEMGDQVLVFLNRRGFAPTLLCHACNWIASCKRCDARLTVHKQSQSLRCHHCNANTHLPAQCPECSSTNLVPLGVGTQRTEEALQLRFPSTSIIRIDRDTTRSKSAMSDIIFSIDDGKPCILIGTQMLAKGHHFPNVTLVAILDVDAGLFSADFRATERMAQLIIQVSGRSGRAEKPGLVAIQTHFADHPILQSLIHDGYASFARQTLQERRDSGLPPYSYMALVRAQATRKNHPSQFLEEVRTLVLARMSAHTNKNDPVEILGPIPSVMERKAGMHRYILLFQCGSRTTLAQVLSHLTDELGNLKSVKLKSVKRVRWSIDVDPLDIF